MTSSSTRSSARYAIVTGVSENGIGYEIVKHLARPPHNYIVTLACRNADRAHKSIAKLTAEHQDDGLDGVSSDRLRFQQVDVGSLNSIRQFAEAYKQSGLPLHALVNNAGVVDGPPTVDGLDAAMAVSHVGPHFLISLLSDVLIANAPSRVINISSGAHGLGSLEKDLSLAFFDARGGGMAHYGTAKLYQMLSGRVWHEQLRSRGVSVFAVHPGVVMTAFVDNNSAYMPLPMRFFIRYVVTPCIGIPADGSGAAIVSAITELPAYTNDPSPYAEAAKRNGRYHAVVVTPNSKGTDDAKARIIFDMTNKIIQEKLAVKGN